MAESSTKRMTAALKEHLVPALEAAGFSGRFPRYRRVGANSIEFMLVAYDNAGTAFFLEFGSHARGAKQTSWGECVPEEKLMIEHALFSERARLQSRCDGGSSPDQWFQFSAFGSDAAAYKSLATTVQSMFPQVEAWLEAKAVGVNVSPNAL